MDICKRCGCDKSLTIDKQCPLCRELDKYRAQIPEMKIEGRVVDEKLDYLNKVTYVPTHAKGNAGHPDCEQGVIVGLSHSGIRVLYCNGRTVQVTDPQDLVWG